MKKLCLGLAMLSAVFPLLFFAGLMVYAEVAPSKWNHFEQDSSPLASKAPNPNPPPIELLGPIDKLVYKHPWWAGAFWPVIAGVTVLSLSMATIFLALFWLARPVKR
jgi:hypothetical protein